MPSASAHERVGPVQCKSMTRSQTKKGLCLENSRRRAYCKRLLMISSPEMSQWLKEGRTALGNTGGLWAIRQVRGWIWFHALWMLLWESVSQPLCWSNHFLCHRKEERWKEEASLGLVAAPVSRNLRGRVSVCLKSCLKDYIYTTVTHYSTRISPLFHTDWLGKQRQNYSICNGRKCREVTGDAG